MLLLDHSWKVPARTQETLTTRVEVASLERHTNLWAAHNIPCHQPPDAPPLPIFCPTRA